MREINQVIVHCSDTYTHMDIGLEEIRGWHVNERGWSDIGYHYVIRRDGIIEFGRHVDRVGAHCRGHNKNSIGICIVGGRSEDISPESNYTAMQWNSLYEFLLPWVNMPDVIVSGHNELNNLKTCPNFNVKAWTEVV